jgi:two-component system, NtrC family, sensor kinase
MEPEPAIMASQIGSYTESRICAGAEELEVFQNFFGGFPDPVIATDLQSRVVFLNDSAKNLTGCCVGGGKLLAGSDILRMDPDDARGSLVEECSNKGTLKGVPVFLKNSVGNWVPFLLSAYFVTDKDRAPIGCVALVRDVLSRSTSTENTIPESIFSSVINNFPMPFFTVDTNLTITYMNHHLEILTGYSSGEVVNRMTCAELFRTPYCHTEDCAIRQAIENRAPIAGLRRSVLDREGRKIPVALHASVITDFEGRVVGGFEAFRDITRVVEAEQKIAMIAENTQEGILIADETRSVIFANSKMAEILDQPKDQLIGRDVSELLPLQHSNIIDDLMQKVDQGMSQQLLFCSTIQPDKDSQQEYRAFETCTVVSRIGKSLITYMFFHDLTKHIEIERQLHNANSFLNNIIRSSADGIVVVDNEGKVLIFNEGAERILGYRAEEVAGKQIATSKIYSPEVAREIKRRMRSNDYGPPGKVTALRLNLVSKDGEDVPVNFSAAIIKKDDREIGSVGIFSDLREQLRIRRELEEAKIQLMQAEKIASVGRLAAGVAHEINNPLSGILLYADMLARDLAHNPQWSADLQEIIDQTLRCKQIVTRLLEFSRQSIGQRIAFDVNNIVNRSAQLLAGQSLFCDVEFVLDLQPDIPEMIGDPGQLQQVFTNFIINAGSAMKGKGKIIITSRFDPECHEVGLQFADTGPGIPLEIMDKIFEPFFTTKRPGEGTGLGLSVAYGIIQQHGGNIEVKNAHSGGALFTVILPLKCPEGTSEPYY